MFTKQEEQSFLNWMRESNTYFTADEYHLRLGIFLTSQRLVREHNANPNKRFTIGINKFSAMTPAEYRAMLGDHPGDDPKSFGKTFNSAKKAAPATVDWREKGVVGIVKDQAQCGSCWAFGAIQALESHVALKIGQLTTFSEQNLVDCCTNCDGCGGGRAAWAYDYIISNQSGNVMYEMDYPYVARDQRCAYNASKAFPLGMKSYGNVKAGDEVDLAEKCAEFGPVEVSIDAGQYTFHSYTGGIYDEPACSSVSLNHAVGCVGYGSEGGVNYWIIRNSWGEDWGEEGYIRMIKDQNNQCGEATRAVYIPDF